MSMSVRTNKISVNEPENINKILQYLVLIEFINI